MLVLWFHCANVRQPDYFVAITKNFTTLNTRFNLHFIFGYTGKLFPSRCWLRPSQHLLLPKRAVTVSVSKLFHHLKETPNTKTSILSINYFCYPKTLSSSAILSDFSHYHRLGIVFVYRIWCWKRVRNSEIIIRLLCWRQVLVSLFSYLSVLLLTCCFLLIWDHPSFFLLFFFFILRLLQTASFLWSCRGDWQCWR